jgi:hypothetical protein
MASQLITHDTPAIPPPDGSAPNFDNPPSLHLPVLGVVVTSIFLTTLAVSVRVYTKAVILKNFKHEDCRSRFIL